ncbi:MAG: cyclase family protein, partial [Dehalococcoidia bacterium]
RRVAEKVRNWGRWGKDDQLGTLNFITAEKIIQAAATVKQGKVFALGIDFNAYGPQGASGFRRNPIHLMSVDGGDEKMLAEHLQGWGGATEAQMAMIWSAGLMRFNDDYIIMPLQAGTQWDALSHVYYDGQMYNGFPASAVTSFGATKNSIDKVDVKGIVSRGVLLDVANHRGVPHLPPNTGITPAELDEVVKAEGVTVESGDIVLVRTGWWPVWEQNRDEHAWIGGSPGLSWLCGEWLHQHEVAAVAVDNIAVEASAADVEGVAILPLHLLCIRDMGMMLGEMWNLEALSRDCAQDKTYTFQLCAPPLRVTGAVGSPINPLAMK